MKAQKYIVRQTGDGKKLDGENKQREDMESKLKKKSEELDEARKRAGQLEQTLNHKQAEYEKTIQGKDTRLGEMEHDLHKITLQNNEYLKQLKDLHDEKENLRISLSAAQKNQVQASQPSWQKDKKQKAQKPRKNNPAPLRRKNPEEYIELLENSTSYRLGQIFVLAVRQPGKNTILMPFRLCKLVFKMILPEKSKNKT